MEPEAAQQLRHLRTSVLQELVGLSDYIAGNEDISYELLLTLARTTGNQSLLFKALDKIKVLEDPKQKSDALLGLLDEIELTIADNPEVQHLPLEELVPESNNEN